MPNKPPPDSALLAAIVGDGEAGIEDRLRAALTNAGGPLIEPIPGDESHSLVTLAWVASPGVQAVTLRSALSPDRQLLNRLAASNCWAKPFVVGNGVRTMYQFFEDEPEFDIAAIADDPVAQANYYAAQAAGLRADPFNPDSIATEFVRAETGKEHYGSVLTMPGARPQQWLAPRDGVARGATESVAFTSQQLGNTRKMYVYMPPGFDPAGTPLPVAILLDGRAFRWVADSPTTLDNLIAEHAIPPMVVVMADNPTLQSRLTEYECNDAFAAMLATELLSWARDQYNVTADPARTIVGGVSYGGLGSAHAALRHPDIFGNVLSLSGSYWWGPSVREAEWLTRQYAQAPATGTRFYLDAGTLESLGNAPLAGATMIAVSRHLRDVLEAKGMDVTFDVFESGHEFTQWRASLADGLIWLTRDW